jgi:hypothetical protein
MGFDNMMLFYEQAVVLRSSIKVTFHNGTNSSARCMIALCPDTVSSTISDYVENGLAVTETVFGQTGGTTGTAASKLVLELQCDVPKYFGRSPKELITSPEFYCTSAANPTEQVYFQVLTWNPVDATSTDVYFDVMMSFDIYYYEPRKLIGS